MREFDLLVGATRNKCALSHIRRIVARNIDMADNTYLLLRHKLSKIHDMADYKGLLAHPVLSRDRPLGPAEDLRLKGLGPGLRTPMYPGVAPHTAKIHTLITLGISIGTNRLVF
jgi:hypothetical protein